jgi:hypothetical protein
LASDDQHRWHLLAVSYYDDGTNAYVVTSAVFA